MTHPHPAAADRSGEALGASYRLLDRIGAGAVGEVWRVTSVSDGTVLAAKILKAEHAADPGLVERFVRERSLLLGLRHPNIVTVQDLVVEGSTLAIVMDYVPGGTLRDLLTQRGSFPAAEALGLAAQVFDALGAAHAKGIVHRDIKPDNVLLAPSAQDDAELVARVSDFGISSVIGEQDRKTTGVAGTPQYMSPELITAGEASRAGDLYAAGVLLYELLAGRTPFSGQGNDFTTIYHHVTSAPPRLELPDELWAFVRSLLTKEPADRPDAISAADTARQLAAQFADLPALLPGSPAAGNETVPHPATMLRGAVPKSVTEHPTSGQTTSGQTTSGQTTSGHSTSDQPAPGRTPPAPPPDLGPADGLTMVRAMPRLQPEPEPEPDPEPQTAPKRFAWLTKKIVIWISIGAVLLAGLGAGGWWLMRHRNTKPPATTALNARQQDQVLPTGLTVAREASYDPETKTTRIEFTYQAQKSALTGEFLEVIPALPGSVACPPVTWEQVSATKHQASTTGLQATCGWKLTGIDIAANSQVKFTATLPAEFHETAELDKWLNDAAGATSGALLATDASSTAYPVQRLQDIQVKTDTRTVSGTTLNITLVPVWPSGPDETNPLYKSPATGAPSQMLVDIARGESGVLFSDSCSGAVVVSSDGLVVTALTMVSDCRLRATVGNFTDLQSTPFNITAR